MTPSPHLARSLIKNSPVALALIASDGRFDAASSPFRDQLALSLDELQEATLSDVLRRCGALLAADALTPLVSGATEALRLTLRLQRPGEPRDVAAVFWRANGETGAGTRIAIQLEVPARTDARQAAAVARADGATELGDAVAALSFAQQMTQIGAWALDPETGVVEFSEQMYALLERDPELGEPTMAEVFTEYFAPDDAARLRDAIDIVLTSTDPKTLELPFITARDHQRWLRLTAAVNPELPTTLRGVAQDVTKGRLQSQQINVVNDRFQHAFEDSHLAMAITALDGRILEANTAMLALLGLTGEQAHQQNMADMLLSEDRVIRDDLIAAAITGTQGSFELESHIVRGDGSLMWVVRHITVLRNSDGTARELLTQMLDATEHHRTEQHLRYLAHHDPLTNLLNRRGFDEALTSQLGHTPRSELDSCLLLLDLNRFKDVNDRCGHTVGDQVLIALAEILHSRLRLTDSIGRLGGDEFAVLLPETDTDGAATIARDIGDDVMRKLSPAGGYGNEAMTVSIGIASVSASLRNDIDLFDAADQAMYRAKAAGLGWIAVYDSGSVEPTASH